jgi:hypothetical protein
MIPIRSPEDRFRFNDCLLVTATLFASSMPCGSFQCNARQLKWKPDAALQMAAEVGLPTCCDMMNHNDSSAVNSILLWGQNDFQGRNDHQSHKCEISAAVQLNWIPWAVRHRI